MASSEWNETSAERSARGRGGLLSFKPLALGAGAPGRRAVAAGFQAIYSCIPSIYLLSSTLDAGAAPCRFRMRAGRRDRRARLTLCPSLATVASRRWVGSFIAREAGRGGAILRDASGVPRAGQCGPCEPSG